MFSLDPVDSWSFRTNEHDIRDPHKKTFRSMYGLLVSGIFVMKAAVESIGEDDRNHYSGRLVHLLRVLLSAPWTFNTWARYLARAFLISIWFLLLIETVRFMLSAPWTLLTCVRSWRAYALDLIVEYLLDPSIPEFESGICIFYFIQILFSTLFSFLFHYFIQLPKIIKNRRHVQIDPNFFSHACVDVDYFLMLFSWIVGCWIFNCDCLIEHDAIWICCIHLLVKCSCLIQLTWNLTCLILTCDMIFWLLFEIFIIYHHCFVHMNM